jgi:Uncharacterized protein conserved in bacteria
MKLLLDENISFRVVKSIQFVFPESIHVTSINSLREDQQIFEFAKTNNFTIVTFDVDFFDLQLLQGFPPKVIWLRFGNSSNLRITSKLLENEKAINSFLSNEESGILEIY